MIGEIFEPLAYYRDELKSRHEQNTAELFEELLRTSGVDEIANSAKVADIARLDREIRSENKRLDLWETVKKALWVIAGLCVIVLFFLGVEGDSFTRQQLFGAVVGSLAVAILSIFGAVAKLTPLIRSIEQLLRDLKRDRTTALDAAWQQMEKLNSLFDWDTATNLMEKTVPGLHFDKYFSNQRLEDLRRSFGMRPDLDNNRSVLYTQSGTINGNPFVLAETLNFHMGSESYSGSKDISWRELERYVDSEGRSRERWVTRHETLYATVHKPCPEHYRTKFLIFGNEAAPDLIFSREPSELSLLGNGFRDRRKIRKATKELEKFSRNLDDDSGFTIMANKEFDVLFGAINRNNEVQFRLLFTPLAQQQMVVLLKDRHVGYGDNFVFEKGGMINTIYPSHLTDVNISANPDLFRSYNLKSARTFFNDYNNKLFKAFYFSLAPLLAIPIYQQHRSHADIYRDVYGSRASSWEHESLANYHGQKAFNHPDCATESILKTRVLASDKETSTVAVTSHGFMAVERIEYVSVWGRDGRYHDVPVEWTEYIDVSHTSTMAVHEISDNRQTEPEEQSETAPGWQNVLDKLGIDHADTLFRRSLISWREQ